MPREPSIVESAKQRSLRVPLDHYEQPDRLARLKWLLSSIAALAAALYAGWIVTGGRAGQKHISPGPVAGVHAAWNDDCQACHRDFQPLRSDAVSVVALFRGRSATRESLDQACIQCHNQPEHHAAAKADEVPSCAACHREHQGRAADIVRPPDSACLNCHRSIELHRTGPSGLAPAVANVKGFGPAPQSGPSPHPEFRSLVGDPGNVKFNHWLHLQPGIAVADAKRKLRVTDLHEADQARYEKFKKDDDLVQLDCTACHQPDAARGATMRPIAFEQHCQACHPLELSLAEGKPPAGVPHGLSADRLGVVLDGLVFAAETSRQESPQPTADESGKLPLIPGKTLGDNLAQKIGRDVLARRAGAARAIASKCQQCHDLREKTDGNDEVPNVAQANIPAAWLRHARFDHRAHRHVECRVCHVGAYAFEQRDKPRFITPSAGAAAARDNEQVMIAGLESCAACHSPARGGTSGARHDCAECHNYHSGDLRTAHAAIKPGVPPPIAVIDADSPNDVEIKNVAFLAAAEMDTASFAGNSSCASSGCHGETRSDAPAWKMAFTRYFANDPHARAYDVLWTYRAREMTRLISPRSQASDEQHRAVLQQRCIGCHATPASHTAESGPAPLAMGVQCESCHGPAGGWLHEHYRAGFSRAVSGFIDTKDLAQRAGDCMGCHVGPMASAGNTQVVDHDLIAAGHPRLAFEFASYFESLPAHWDRRADEARHAGEFHFRSWLAGQQQLDEHRQPLSRERPGDFAQLDCFACHHSLRGESWNSKPQSAVLQSVVWPPATLLNAADPQWAPAERLRFVQSLLLDASNSDVRWDAAVQSYLAARAVAGDMTNAAYPGMKSQIAAVNAALASLGEYLARDCFAARRDNRRPTPYDSPTNFAPEILADRIRNVTNALQRLEAAVSAR